MNGYKIVIFILLVFSPLIATAENELCIINDPDGFTNVRSGKGTNFSVVAILEKDDFFYADIKDGQDWIKIVALKWIDGIQVEGYIHKSRIQPVKTLNLKRQEKIIKDILAEQQRCAEAFTNEGQSVWVLSNHSEIKYSPVLEIFPQYFCKTKDTTLLQLFYSVMWADSGSANEVPSFTIGECFICDPQSVIYQIELLSNKEQQEFILDKIEWGLYNSDNRDKETFEKQLHNERERIMN